MKKKKSHILLSSIFETQTGIYENQVFKKNTLESKLSFFFSSRNLGRKSHPIDVLLHRDLFRSVVSFGLFLSCTPAPTKAVADAI